MSGQFSKEENNKEISFIEISNNRRQKAKRRGINRYSTKVAIGEIWKSGEGVSTIKNK